MRGVAVPYIIAILLGVAVIGLIGYWFFIAGGKFGTSSKEAQCNSDFATYCSEWLSSGSKPRTWDQSCNTLLKITGTRDDPNKPSSEECRSKGYTTPSETRPS